MSKQFVTFDRFNAEIKSLRRDFDELLDVHNDIIEGKWEQLEKVKEAVNTNADGCQELESRVDELTKRLDKMNRSMQIMRQDVNAKNTDGLTAAWGVGLCGFIALACLVAKVNALAKEIDAIEAQVKKESQRVVTEKPAPEVSFHEDGTYDTKNRVSDDVSSEKSKEG